MNSSTKLPSFDVILLDQGKTFLFENDRFGHEVNYAATYRELGGASLIPARVHLIVARLYDHFLKLSRDPASFEAFPTIAEAIRDLPELAVPEVDIDRLDDLFAFHELGLISTSHATTLRALAKTHRLGVVSNIWAQPERFVVNLERVGVRACFEHLVWSSERGWIKPSHRLFEYTLKLFNVRPARVLFVGDNPRRDIHPAKILGLSAVWIRNPGAVYPADLRAPDRILDDLNELPGLF